MAALNRCTFIGNMTADPEIRSVGDSQVANFTIAVSEKFTDKQGNKREDTQFIRCNAWGRLSEIISNYTSKGSQVYVEGKWKTRAYEKDSIKHYVTECQVFSLQMLGSKQQSGNQPGNQPGYSQQQNHQVPPDNNQGGGFVEDDIPF